MSIYQSVYLRRCVRSEARCRHLLRGKKTIIIIFQKRYTRASRTMWTFRCVQFVTCGCTLANCLTSQGEDMSRQLKEHPLFYTSLDLLQFYGMHMQHRDYREALFKYRRLPHNSKRTHFTRIFALTQLTHVPIVIHRFAQAIDHSPVYDIHLLLTHHFIWHRDIVRLQLMALIWCARSLAY